MPNLNDETSLALFTMLKGEPGTRKSTSALSWPTPHYWISQDKKMGALKLPARNWGIPFSEINYDDFKDWNEIHQKLKALRTNVGKTKTLIFDSITSIGDTINLQTMRLTSGTTNKSGGEAGLRIGGITVNSLDHYKAETAAFQELIDLTSTIRKFHNVNIVLIAHVVGDRLNPSGIKSFARTIVTGGKAISAKLSAYCEEVYHFYVAANPDASKEGEYGIITTHTGEDFARTTLPLPKSLLFNNQPLYPTYIQPAINKLNEKG